MAITMIQPLYAGNAIRLYLTPPAGARYWRVLKSGSEADITAHTDPDQYGAEHQVYDDDPLVLLAYEGDGRVFIDSDNLINEVAAFYKVFYRMGDDTWQSSAVASATPLGTYEEYTTDVMSFLRQRLQDGLTIEVKRGNLMHELGYIQVFTSPPSLENNLRFPLVTLTLDNESPANRGIGEDIMGDDYDEVGDSWRDTEGWLQDVSITIVAWSQNSNERIELRKAIRRVILANLPVLADRGITLPNLTAQDVDAINGEYTAQIYQTFFTFSCVAPVRVGYRPGSITNIEVEYPNG